MCLGVSFSLVLLYFDGYVVFVGYLAHLLVLAAIYDAGELLQQVEVVGDHDDGGALFAHLLEDGDYLLAGLLVKVAGGLVGQDDAGGVEQCSGYGDALLFATAEFVWVFVNFFGQLDEVEHFVDALPTLSLALPAGGSEYEVEVLAHGVVGQQLKVLEDDAQLLAQFGDVFSLELAQIEAQDFGAAGAEGQFAVEGLEQGALAGAYLADDVDELAFVDVKFNVLKHGLVFLTDVCAVELYEHGGCVLR